MAKTRYTWEKRQKEIAKKKKKEDKRKRKLEKKQGQADSDSPDNSAQDLPGQE